MTTAPESQPLVRQQDAPNPYLSGVTSRDFAPLEFRLMQYLSEAVKTQQAEPGEFYCPQTAERYTELVFIPLRIQGVRTLWSDDPNQVAPSCASNDRVRANAGTIFDDPQTGRRLCAQCEFRNDAPYELDAEERRHWCTPGFSILGIVEETGLPFIYRASGASVQAIRTLLTLVQTADGQPFRLRVAFTAKQRARGNNTYLALGVSPRDRVPEEQIAYYKQLADHWITQEVAWTHDGTDSNGTVPEPSQAALNPTSTQPVSTIINAAPTVAAAPNRPPVRPASPRQQRAASNAQPGVKPGPAPTTPRRGPPPGGFRSAPPQSQQPPSQPNRDIDNLPF